jgi:hypothetical protein
VTAHKASILTSVGLPVLACGLTIVGCGTAKSAGLAVSTKETGKAQTLMRVTRSITIDRSAGILFAPPPAQASPAMSAEHAWEIYMERATGKKHSAIPSNVRVQLGLLTLPMGPTGPHGTEKYTAHNELVYGFSWHSCPISTSPVPVKLPPNPCIQWNLLNAYTARQVVDTWQI